MVDVEIIRRVAVVALERCIIRHHIPYPREGTQSRWVLEDLVAWEIHLLSAPVELQRMAVILFLEPSIVMEVDMEEPMVASIMAGQEDRVAALHVLRPVVRPLKLPPVLEMPEAVL